MKLYKLIVEQIKENEEFRLISAKENVLNEALYALTYYTTNIYEYFGVFQEIEASIILDETLDNNLTSLNIELTNTDDFKVPSGLEIEELCHRINEIGPNEDVEISLWEDKFPLNKLFFEESVSFRDVVIQSLDYIRCNEKTLFSEFITFYKQKELLKESLIQQLEKKLAPIKKLAEDLLKNDEIEEKWGSKLQDICDAVPYENNFNTYFLSKQSNILEEYSQNLNNHEKALLSDFFEQLCDELYVL